MLYIMVCQLYTHTHIINNIKHFVIYYGLSIVYPHTYYK